jgi:hypothetical protein
VNQNHSDQEAVKTFIDQIRWLYEAEYGDFKRKVGLYIQRLEETHPQLVQGRAKEVLSEIKSKVIYNPSGDIEATRRQILQMAHELLNSPGSGPLH